MSQDNATSELSGSVRRTLLTVIIKAFNEERNITRAIESSLRECDGVESEIIVADSASTDRTVEFAARYPVAVVRLADPAERCCGIGPQMGYQHARGEFIYILDGDMEFELGFIRTALNRLREDSHLAAVAGTVTELGCGSYEFEYRRQALAPLLPGPQRWLEMGGLYRRKAVESVGYFSNRNLHSDEEEELGLRLTVAGWRMERMAVPAVRHFGHKDSTIQLISKRWRSHYVDGTGELLHSSFGKPYFFEVLVQQAKLIVIIGGWLFTAGACLTVAWSLWPMSLAALFWVTVLVIQSMRKKSLSRGTLSIFQLQILAAGFVRGFLSEQLDPMTPVRSLVVKEPWNQSMQAAQK